MNQLASLGIILLLALLAGHLVKWARVPEVTGYLLAGIALGPSALGWVSADNLTALEVLSEVALGLILFSIGTVFEVERFRRIGRQLTLLVATESALAAGLVASGALIVGQPWTIALLLGALAIETAAASTLMVLRECNAHGPVTEMLTAVFAVDNLVCLVAFSVVAAVIELSSPATTFYEAAYPLVWQVVGSLALGYLIGFLLSMWSPRVIEHGERLILLAGCVLLGVGLSNLFELSPLVTNLTVGATLVNLSAKSRGLFESLAQTDPPLYAIFFVLAGAELDVSLLKSIGVLGGVYLGGRIIGKFAGARFGVTDLTLRKYLSTSMFAQAGLAVGLSLSIHRRFPELAPTVVTVVLASVLVFEIIGPLSVRWTLMRAGEAHLEENPSTGVIE